VISSSQRPLPDNTQHSQQTNIHATGGIRTHSPSKRAAADLRLRSRGHWDKLCSLLAYQLLDYLKKYGLRWCLKHRFPRHRHLTFSSLNGSFLFIYHSPYMSNQYQIFVCFLMGYSPASEFCVLTFRNTLFNLHRQVVVWFTQPPAYEDGKDIVFRNVGIQNSDSGE
jgi:hypothetical protein